MQLSVERISKLQALDVVNDELVRTQFIKLYDTLHGAGEAAYERESFYFNEKLRETPALQKATPFSIFTCFIDLALCGLSLEPGGKALCYLQGRNAYIGNDQQGKKIYEPRLALTISGYGELVMRARCGQIKYADNPVLVYEEDEFSYGDRGGQKVVDYMCHYPHKSNHIIAAFIRITRTDGSVDYSIMLEEDWMRLQDYSARQNSRWDNEKRQYVNGQPNALYTSNAGGIDSGFLIAKLIKHAFKTYPKVRLGNGTELESQQEDLPQQDVNDIYGVGDNAAPNMAAPKAPWEETQQAAQAATAAPAMQGVTIDPASSPTDDGTF